MTNNISQPDGELREQAIKRLRAKRDLMGHLIAYVGVNALLGLIWYMTFDGFFWPLFVILGWGIGLAINAWEVYAPKATADQIASEMERLRHRSI